MLAVLSGLAVAGLDGAEPSATAKPAPLDTRSRFAGWEGEWVFSKPLNRALGFPETLVRGESHGGMPWSFRLRLDKRMGASLPEGELETLRDYVFDKAGLEVIATGRWLSRSAGDPEEARHIRETSCYLLRKEGGTYLYHSAMYVVVLGGRASLWEGRTPTDDKLVIDFGSEPWSPGPASRSEQTYAYERVGVRGSGE